MDKSKHESCQLRVFYDGACVVCSQEIDLYRRKDKQNRIAFVNIASPSFKPALEGVDPSEVQTVFHVKDFNNNLYKGVDGFIAIWDLLEIFRPLSFLAKSSFTRPLLDLGYFTFSKVRPFLPRKQCHDGSCKI